MESTIVIKVKYGETLRRFSAHVYEDELDLDMGGLREKVHSLFHIAPDADMTLTYADEDGDVVTLVDEEDLRDVVRQSLNPLRITVKLNTEKGGRSYARSNGSSTPMRSSEVQHPLPNLNSGIAEILKAVPEPFREAFSKVSLDLASKTAYSAPGLTELVESFSKMGQLYMNSVFESQSAAEPSTYSGASGSTMNASVGKDPEVSKDDGVTSEVLPNMKFEEPTSKKEQDVDLGNVAIVEGTTVTPLAHKVPAGGNGEEMKSGDCGVGGKSANVDISTSSADSMRLCNSDRKTTNFGGDISKHFPSGYEKSPVPHVGLSPFKKCPFSGMPLANDQDATRVQFTHPLNPFKRNPSDRMGSVFHRGVCCDGCDVHPITGPRFKSKVKEDYDLCSICFARMGNEADYIRMDHPVSHPNPWSFKGLCDTMQQNPLRTPMGPPTIPHFLKSWGMNSKGSNLDSRFIWDVNVPDDTVMSPSTPFTKIWRMRNNGSVVWPQGTQLVWIGGDKLSDTLSVQVGISGDGLPVGNELDIAVDFTAPVLPGRYVSYWRMASPSGEKFGQTVFVIIQVDTALRDSSGFSLRYLNLNLPPHSDSNGITGPEIMNASVEPMVNDSLLEAENNSKATESVKTIVEELKSKDLDLNFPINNNLLVGGGVTIPVPSIASPAVSGPIIDLPDVAPFHPPHPVTNGPALVSVPGVGESNDVEQTLLRELEEMGFNQVYLNKEILRLNEYNMEQSVDDLAEWYPILQELQEMGFCDEETNTRLLKMNNGSIQHVVMDLIARKIDTAK